VRCSKVRYVAVRTADQVFDSFARCCLPSMKLAVGKKVFQGHSEHLGTF
jgi:hypothetical protein